MWDPKVDGERFPCGVNITDDIFYNQYSLRSLRIQVVSKYEAATTDIGNLMDKLGSGDIADH